jgi:transposase-like protein
MGRTRRTFSAQQKTQIALEALRERQTLSEIAQKFDVHPSQITGWKKQVLDGMQTLFEQPRQQDTQQQEEKIALLYQQIGQLQFELDWLKKKTNRPAP